MATTTKKRGRPPKSSGKKKQETHLNRRHGIVIFAILTIITFLSLLGFDGFLLKWLYAFLSGLTGIGVYVMPFCFLGAMVLCIIRRKGPIRLRLFCILLVPVLFSGISHALAGAVPPDKPLLVGLYVSGVAHQSGGLLGGGLAYGLVSAISTAGTVIVLLLLLILALCISFHITISSLAAFFRPQEYAYDSPEEEEKYTAPNPVVTKAAERAAEYRAARSARKAKPRIDIPLDDEPAPVSKPPANDVISPADYLEHLDDGPKEKVAKTVDQLLIDQALQPAGKAAAEPLEAEVIEPVKRADPPERLSPEEAKKLSEDIDNSQKTPVSHYVYPSLSLLAKPQGKKAAAAADELKLNSERLLDTLKSFNVDAQLINIVRGPSVTRFELTISRGTKFSKVTALSDDIALSLGASNVRIAPIPDKLAIGIEVPNKDVNTVFLREIIASPAFQKADSKLSFALGKDITGNAIVGDIAKMPHMLIAGTTGSGKSVCINSLLVSLLYKSSPEDVRLIMVDPKMIELSAYNGIPHLLIPVVTDPKKAAGALNWAVGEMMRRYKLFADAGAKKLSEYNDIMRRNMASGEEGEFHTLPQVVIVIDELADLMMVSANEVEDAICRIAQMARAAGMHLVIATQRPSADVITGIMKANIPSRIAFAVASQIESRIILDQTGAEKLIGKGDMLFNPLGASKPLRIQGCFLSSREVEEVTDFVKKTGNADYSEEIIQHIEREAEKNSAPAAGEDGSGDYDPLIDDAIDIVVGTGQASVSMLQRKLKLGYARAARLVDQMEERGIVGPFEGSKPRQVLITKDDWQEIKLRKMDSYES